MKSEDWGIDTVEVWTVALTEMGITPAEFALAHKKSLLLDWQPTTPADFFKLAQEGLASEYPNSRSAFQFACKNEGMTADVKKSYDHVVVYETVKRIGGYSLRNADDQYFKTWDGVYQEVVSEHKNGADFALPKSHQIQHKHIPAQKAVADNAVTKIKTIMGRRVV